MLQGLSKYKKVYVHLWRTYGSSWQTRLSFVLQFMSRLCKLIALPIALSLLIARLSAQDYAGARNAVLIYAAFSLTLGALIPLIKYLGMLGENRAYLQASGDYFSRLIHADLEYFNSNLSGYLTAATRQYVDSSIHLVRALRDKHMTTILSIVFPLCIIAWLDIWLGLVALGLSIAQAVYLLWASNAIGPYRSLSRELYKRNSGVMADVISNILAVRSNAQEAAYVARVRQGAFEENRAFSRRYAMQAKLLTIREFITVVFFAVLLWLTVERMSGGHISITAAVLIATYTTTILTGVYALTEGLDEHDDMIDKIIPAFEVLDRVNSINDPRKPKVLRGVTGDIRLDKVSFAYDKDKQGRWVFKDFSLHIPAGQKIGVVGLSGAGKSTLTKLLLRFNDVDSGHVRIDGIDITEVRQTDLRTHIAYVPQEPLLFHASIRENVLLSKPNATEAEVVRALKAAHAYTFVSQLPDGLDSMVGERGVKLSGGQKQRIAIARAVLRHAPIIVLDEATSALDSESEQIIKDSFSEILKDKTAIVIAHRLSTLSEMDRIIVIDKGSIVEDGSHDELVARNGAYARLWRRQQRHLDEPEVDPRPEVQLTA